MNNSKICKIELIPLNASGVPTIFDGCLSYIEVLGVFAHKLNDVIVFINSVLDKEIIEYIDKRFEDIMMDSIYDPETETLLLELTHDADGK